MSFSKHIDTVVKKLYKVLGLFIWICKPFNMIALIINRNENVQVNGSYSIPKTGIDRKQFQLISLEDGSHSDIILLHKIINPHLDLLSLITPACLTSFHKK